MRAVSSLTHADAGGITTSGVRPEVTDPGMGRDGALELSRQNFAQLAKPFLPRLYRLARRLTAQPADAEDLVHDTHLRAYQACERVRFVDAEGCHAWLSRIMINLYRDQYRRRMRSPFVSPAGPDGRMIVDDLVPSDDPGPASHLDRRRFAQAADAAIASLPPELRLIIGLFLVDGLTYEQIAECADVPAGTVMSRLWRARRLLRERLRPHLGSDALGPDRRDRRRASGVEA